MGLCLRRLVLQYSWRGGRFQPESMAAFNRNQWQPSTGIGGRVRPESVAIFARNTQSKAYAPNYWDLSQRLWKNYWWTGFVSAGWLSNPASFTQPNGSTNVR